MTDERLIELAHHLSTLAGMKMVDITPLALVLAPDPTKHAAVALQLRDDARTISMLLEASAYLFGRADVLRSYKTID